MVRAFIAMFFVLIVASVTVTGGAVGVEPSRPQPSVDDQVTIGRTVETWQMNAQGYVGSATRTESRMKASVIDTLRNIPLLWLVSFAVLVLVLIVGGVVYRSDTRAKTADKTDTSTSTATITEEDLISDDDRVLMLLRDNNGRMRQADIVHETEWSKSKVSVVLSEMDDEDLISKLRIGRENIISITGDEPEAARSPFEDEK